jgi:hypothetical protein
MSEHDHSNPYRDTNAVTYYAMTGDPTRGGMFGDDSSYLKPLGGAYGDLGPIGALLLSMVLLGAGLYSWLG